MWYPRIPRPGPPPTGRSRSGPAQASFSTPLNVAAVLCLVVRGRIPAFGRGLLSPELGKQAGNGIHDDLGGLHEGGLVPRPSLEAGEVHGITDQDPGRFP